MWMHHCTRAGSTCSTAAVFVTVRFGMGFSSERVDTKDSCNLVRRVTSPDMMEVDEVINNLNERA